MHDIQQVRQQKPNEKSRRAWLGKIPSEGPPTLNTIYGAGNQHSILA